LCGITFSDAGVDVSQSIDGGRIYCRRPKGIDAENSFNILGESLSSPSRGRSNSECLYCTGQVPDKVFDDPDFQNDLDSHSDEEDE
jgi:hypothetical protein